MIWDGRRSALKKSSLDRARFNCRVLSFAPISRVLGCVYMFTIEQQVHGEDLHIHATSDARGWAPARCTAYTVAITAHALTAQPTTCATLPESWFHSIKNTAQIVGTNIASGVRSGGDISLLE